MPLTKIVNGTPVPMSPEEEADFVAEQDANNTIEMRRASQWERIKAKRDHLSDTGGYKVVVGGVDKWFHSDPKSKTQQLVLFVMGASVPSIQWKTMDGSFVTITQTLAGQIFQAAATQDATIFAVAEAHRLALEASADPLAYDYSAGWPESFQG